MMADTRSAFIQSVIGVNRVVLEPKITCGAEAAGRWSGRAAGVWEKGLPAVVGGVVQLVQRPGCALRIPVSGAGISLRVEGRELLHRHTQARVGGGPVTGNHFLPIIGRRASA